MNRRQEVVPGHRAAGLTLERHNNRLGTEKREEPVLVFLPRSDAQVHRREHRKNVGLNDSHKNMQTDK